MHFQSRSNIFILLDALGLRKVLSSAAAAALAPAIRRPELLTSVPYIRSAKLNAVLDFNKLMNQIDQVGQESLDESLDEHEKLATAHQAYDDAASVAEEFAERLAANQSLVLWPVAAPLERFG